MAEHRTGGDRESMPDFTPYAGRWVAVVRGRVVGVGAGRAQAYRAAKWARPKEEPQLLFISPAGRPETEHD